ncbi:hypothetical protein [Fluviicola sp.]|uniref:hypothetical protein n=1 Tax=Fluviicola sp. TaxID=1917219 RepID=UPI0031D369BE
MINASNYFREIEKLDISKLPEQIVRGYNQIAKTTSNGKNWSKYETNSLIKEAIDQHFENLNAYLGKKGSFTRKRVAKARTASAPRKRTTTATKTKRPVAKKKPVLKKDIVIGKTRSGKTIYELYNHPKHKNFTARDHEDAGTAQLNSNKSTLTIARRDEQVALHAKKRDQILAQDKKVREQKKTKARALKVRKAARLKKRTYHFEGEHVERITEELKFIKRFVLMHGKSKTPQQIRLFINALQKAMTEKRIRKTSKYATEILEIQDLLLSLYTKLKGRKAIKVEIGEERRSHFLTITGKQRLLPSVRIIKSYISLQGRIVPVAAAKNLLTRIDKALLTKAVPLRDPYAKQISEITQTLNAFIAKTKVEGVLLIPSRELNGLNGIMDELEGISFNSELDGFNGFGSIPDDAIINTLDIVNMEFPTIGFTGKWLRFVGDPNKGFTAMVFGLPKYGKSYLCVDWAGYLARNHGRVLYVAKEEKVGGTLKTKLRETQMAHPNFDSTGALPMDLSDYDFVFLDSVTKLGLSPEDLDELKAEYPGVSFIYVFQTTKQGAFRGSNGYQHDVDIVIEVPEPGKAIQYGRYNQRSEMDITF